MRRNRGSNSSSSSNNNLGTWNCKRFRALVLVCEMRKRLVSSGLVAKRLFPILLAWVSSRKLCLRFGERRQRVPGQSQKSQLSPSLRVRNHSYGAVFWVSVNSFWAASRRCNSAQQRASATSGWEYGTSEVRHFCCNVLWSPKHCSAWASQRVQEGPWSLF